MTRNCSVEQNGKACGRAMRQTAIIPTDGGPQYVIHSCDHCDHRACSQRDCRLQIIDGAAAACPVGHPL